MSVDTVPIIQCEDVAKMYAEKIVLRDVTLSIRQGEFLTLVGPSGCGKTTFLRMINALLLPDVGVVRVFGESTATADTVALRRRIGYVIQSIALFPHMSVRKNMEYVPSLYKDPPESLRSTEELLHMVSLEPELLDRKPDALSGGQQQRVGIARALAGNPSILLMDEPFSAVDEIARQSLQESIQRIHRELGITVLFVTHSIDEAVKLGTRMAVFGNSEIQQLDAPEVVLSNPANAFVRDFVERNRG